MPTLFEELRRRNVIRVMVAYIVVGWVVMQVAEFMQPLLRLPEWTVSLASIVGGSEDVPPSQTKLVERTLVETVVVNGIVRAKDDGTLEIEYQSLGEVKTERSDKIPPLWSYD